jgi:branched-chain amino acid transport system substrate-binding protein
VKSFKLFLVLTLFLSMVLSACGESAPVTITSLPPTTPATAAATATAPSGETPSGIPFLPPAATATLAPTATPVPTATPIPPKPIVIGVIVNRTGIVALASSSVERGLALGIEFYTNGTNKIGNRPLKIVVEDDGGDPLRAAEAARKLVRESKAEILVGATSNASTLAIAEANGQELKTPFLVEIADGLALTGEKFNSYTFRLSANLDQEAAALRYLLADTDATRKVVAHLYPNSDAGSELNEAWKAAPEPAAEPVQWLELAQLPASIEFVAPLQRALSGGTDVLVVSGWSGQAQERLFRQMVSLNMFRNMTVTGGVRDLAVLRTFSEDAIGFRAVMSYWHLFPTTTDNDFLVQKYRERHKTVPDAYSAGGFATASALVTAYGRAGNEPDAAKLVAAMEGMSFTSPKGKLVFRKEDHQALQPMYVTRLAKDTTGTFDFLAPLLVKELPLEETAPPVRRQ